MEPVNVLYFLLSSRTENGARGEACQTLWEHSFWSTFIKESEMHFWTFLNTLPQKAVAESSGQAVPEDLLTPVSEGSTQ